MVHEESFFQGTGQLNLYFQSWRPDAETRAVIVIVHGVGEHCGRYGLLVNSLRL
jgi:alpha-beta hydrolase superfamily lysophospholipase